MKTLEEIEKIREQKRAELDLRVNTSADTREMIANESSMLSSTRVVQFSTSSPGIISSKISNSLSIISSI